MFIGWLQVKKVSCGKTTFSTYSMYSRMGAIAAFLLYFMCKQTNKNSHKHTQSHIHAYTLHTHCDIYILKRLVTCNTTLFFSSKMTLKFFGHEPIFTLFASFIGLLDLFMSVMNQPKIIMMRSNLLVVVVVVVIVVSFCRQERFLCQIIVYFVWKMLT